MALEIQTPQTEKMRPKSTYDGTVKEPSVLSYKNFRNFLPFNGVIFLATYIGLSVMRDDLNVVV